MKKKNYIFLDIDGVLTNKKHYLKLYKKDKGSLTIENSISGKNLKILKKIYKKLNKECPTEIILSSTWRFSEKDTEIVDANLAANGLPETSGITPKDFTHRGLQILKCLEVKKCLYKKVVIIDDDSYDIKPYLKKDFIFINTDTYKGLTYKDYFKFLIDFYKAKKEDFLWKIYKGK